MVTNTEDAIKDATKVMLNPGDTTLRDGIEYVAYARDESNPEHRCPTCAFNKHKYGCLDIVCDVGDKSIVFKEKPQELIW